MNMVVLPYISGFTEKLDRIFRKHKITTAVRPHQTLRQWLVHAKDKIRDNKKCNVVYSIPCANCEKQYVGETGRPFEARLQEHKKEAGKLSNCSYTRSTRKTSVNEQNKSAITEHVTENRVMVWDNYKIMDSESDKFKRWVRESIQIRNTNPSMNRNEGAFHLLRIWDQVTLPRIWGGGGGLQPSSAISLHSSHTTQQWPRSEENSCQLLKLSTNQ